MRTRLVPLEGGAPFFEAGVAASPRALYAYGKHGGAMQILHVSHCPMIGAVDPFLALRPVFPD